MRQPVSQPLRRHVPRIGQREQAPAIDQLVVHRIDDEDRGYTVEPPGDAVVRGDVAVLVVAPDIHLRDDEMLVDERLEVGQFHDRGEHAAIAAPVAAEIDQQFLVLVPGLRTRLGDDRRGVGLLVIRVGQGLGQLIDAGDRHVRGGWRGRCGGGDGEEGEEGEQRERKGLDHGAVLTRCGAQCQQAVAGRGQARLEHGRPRQGDGGARAR